MNDEFFTYPPQPQGLTGVLYLLALQGTGYHNGGVGMGGSKAGLRLESGFNPADKAAERLSQKRCTELLVTLK